MSVEDQEILPPNFFLLMEYNSKGDNMKIRIRNFWNAETEVPISTVYVAPEEVLKNIGYLTICEIVIDEQSKGAVKWDGKKLSIFKSSVPAGAFS